jgi:hypothetical protein
MRKGSSLQFGPDEDDEDRGPGQEWRPRLRDPDLSHSDVTSRASGLDVLALLVSIYGSTDLFVKDYRALLADQLLQNLEYRADKEMSVLELLKIRFGEPALHSCEVMLRDLEESRRTNAAVLKAMRSPPAPATAAAAADVRKHAGAVDLLVLSEHYWPALPTDEDSLTLAPLAKRALQAYLDTYCTVRKPRHLTLAPQLGSAELELAFDDGSVRTFACSPAQASAILFVIGDDEGAAAASEGAEGSSSSSGGGGGSGSTAPPSVDGKVSLAELSAALGVPEAEAHRYAAYWVSRGVLQVLALSAEEATAREAAKATQRQQLGLQPLAAAYEDPFADPPDEQAGPAADRVLFSVDEQQAGRAAAEAAKAKRLVDGGEQEHGAGSDADAEEEDEDEGAGGSALAAAAAAADQAAVSTYEGYVRGLLQGHGSMELERLHTMLKLVMGGGSGEGHKFDMSVLAFQRFLGGLVERGLLEQEEGVYRLH